jgi:hypothetical protein
MPQGLAGRGRRDRLAFRLFDPRKRFAPSRREAGPRAVPRIRVIGRDPRVIALWAPPPVLSAPPPDDGRIDARRLTLRLQAVKLALDDLPRQARRLVRLRARREKVPDLRFRSPQRPGRPPGHRRRPVHEIDRVLAECHALAWDAMAPNTS